jgi:uncharacterized membrane protein YhaH (DUF805 family)
VDVKKFFRFGGRVGRANYWAMTVLFYVVFLVGWAALLPG